MRGIVAVPAFGLVAAGIALAPPPPATPDDGPHVDIRGFAFAPRRIEVRAGERVIWSNADPVPHTATAADGAWDTGNLPGGASAGIRFDEPGVHAYTCAYHPQMRGEIVVRE